MVHQEEGLQDQYHIAPCLIVPSGLYSVVKLLEKHSFQKGKAFRQRRDTLWNHVCAMAKLPLASIKRCWGWRTMSTIAAWSRCCLILCGCAPRRLTVAPFVSICMPKTCGLPGRA